jgi:hypothetical protein
MRLFATDFWASYGVARPFELPHHSGSLLRGVLGRALRLHGCTAPAAPCAQDCLQPARCAYSRLFDPPVPDPLPHPFLRGSTRAPQPLIPLFPRPGKAHLRQGDTLEFGLRILGMLAPGDAERLLAALESFAEFPLGSDGGRVEFSEVRQRGARNRIIDVGAGEPEQGQCTVELETPVWLAHKGRLLNPEALDFLTLFRHTYRRLTMLAALYGELPPDSASAFRDLDQLAPGVRTAGRHLRALRWERLSLERNERLPMMGLVGSILFDGPIGPFLPALRAVELTHLGKATSHGLGRICVSNRSA